MVIGPIIGFAVGVLFGVVLHRRSHFNDVRRFQRRFGWAHPPTPRFLSYGLIERFDLIDEERREMLAAFDTHDLPAAADALVDLVYVVLGLAALMGLPWQQLWDDVHRANMRKHRGVKPERGHTHDVVKPPGWVGPQTRAILRRAGWRP